VGKKQKKTPLRSSLLFLVFGFFFFQLCGVVGGVLNLPQTDSTKFGYKLNIKVIF